MRFDDKNTVIVTYFKAFIGKSQRKRAGGVVSRYSRCTIPAMKTI